MKLIADLHIHSRFSRATSRDLDFVTLHASALSKGIGLIGTGDFTHPGWMAEIEEQLVPAEDGYFKLRPDLQRIAEASAPNSCRGEVRFVLQVEISNIYKKGERTRKNHNLVFVPSLDAAKRFTERLSSIGNLASDGRPILGLDARDLLELTLETDPSAFLVPAHIWTPWFSMLGSKSGFDSVEECFSDLANEIFAVETGLSSDPPMNWRVAELDRMSLISNSDAHSASKLGREANWFDIEPGYASLFHALKTGEGLLATLEFFPEHGKYHLDGHRKCGLRLSPEESRNLNGRCPNCGGPLTVGVMSRVMDLAEPTRPPGFVAEHPQAFYSLVPLEETTAEVLGASPSSKKVADACQRMLGKLGPELYILKDAPLEDIERATDAAMREAIRRVRCGELSVEAGYDGEFGNVRIFTPNERAALTGQSSFALGVEFESRVPSPASAAVDGVECESPPLASTQAQAVVRHQPELNAKQVEVVLSATGPLAVSAGPGTGKTRTLTARVVHHVTAGTWQADRVLALTFTNQAAAELRGRLEAELGQAPCPKVMTFHGFGRVVLETLFGRSVELVQDEQRSVLMAEALGATSTRRSVERMLDAISLLKQSTRLPAELDVEVRTAYQRYQSLLDANKLLDLDDLVLVPYEMLVAEPSAAERLIAQFDALCVDEYQDVNDVQAALVKLLSPDGRNLLVIGDPDQAIYGFRGARPGHFLRFRETFPSARELELDTTYRLPEPILRAAQSVLTGKQRPLSSLKHGPKVELVACATEDSEAEQLLVRMERLLGGTSHFAVNSGRGGDAEEPDIGFGDMAILCRLKAQRDAVLSALSRSGIPCLLVGEDEPHDPRCEKVAIMTMHASKGREFEIVFIVGVEPGLMPLELEGLSSDPEEERRLLYVAATRAKRRLILSHTRQRVLYGRRLPGGPSPFLANLPKEAIERRSAMGSPAAVNRQLRLF